MSNGFLSQEEIDALLRGEPVSDAVPELSDMENDAFGEIGNISMGSAATTLSVLLNRRVSITTPKVSITTLNEIKNQYPSPYLVIEVDYTHGIIGTNVLAMRAQDALIIADLMMGNDGSNPPTDLNELYMSAVSEAMNQMMGSVATSMSTVLKKRIDIAPPKVTLIDFATNPTIFSVVSGDEFIVRVSFRMEVDGLIDSEIMQIVTVAVAKEMVNGLLDSVQLTVKVAHATPAPTASALEYTNNHQALPVTEHPNVSYSQQAAASVTATKIQNEVVQPVQFAPLKAAGSPITDTNIGLLMDVPLQITVELGRTKKLIRDILELSPGSVVELDKLAGEPVDILANGKLIAKGEVVVIDENFGVRITDIVGQVERVTLQ